MIRDLAAGETLTFDVVDSRFGGCAHFIERGARSTSRTFCGLIAAVDTRPDRGKRVCWLCEMQLVRLWCDCVR